eukprot:6188801-Pleurochrysis_carterae.AAC.3
MEKDIAIGRRFACVVLDENRRHMMFGAFASSMWARWDVCELSGSEDSSGGSDKESTGKGTNLAELVQPVHRIVANVMHPEYGRKCCPVPWPYMLLKECHRHL